MKWQASLEVDDDLIEGRDYIRGDNDIAARAFLNTALHALGRSLVGRTFRKRERDDAAAGGATGFRSSGGDHDKLAAIDHIYYARFISLLVFSETIGNSR